ncbi:MAG: hypothetical protein ACR2NN_19680 [Bryobacteraceae bacterium]
MSKLLRLVTLLPVVAYAASAEPVISAVLNGASYNAVVSPGCWVAVFGTHLAPTSQSAQAGLLRTTLSEVSVTVGGLSAPLQYVFSNQINALIPLEVEIPPATVVPLVVTSLAGSNTYNLRLTRNAPAIFTRNGAGTGRALVFNANFQAVDTIVESDIVILYAAGLGPTDRSGRVLDDVEVYIGERKAQVLFAGLAPGFPGIYQLNVKAPAPATDRLYLRSGGWQTNIVDVGIRAGANTANATSTIDGLNPSSDPNYPVTPQRPCVGDNDPGPCGPASGSESFSVILYAGSFTVSLDIVPPASPFDIAAVGEGGGSIISINPAAGTYTASVTTLTAAERNGDFSSSVAQLWDYFNCDWKSAVCKPLPRNTLPPSRLLLFWVRVFQMLLFPNATESGNPNAFLQVSGALNGSRIVIDDRNNRALSRFGGVVQVPYSPFASPVSTFKLYVDGKLIASKDLPYLVYQRAPKAFIPTGNITAAALEIR